MSFEFRQEMRSRLDRLDALCLRIIEMLNENIDEEEVEEEEPNGRKGRTDIKPRAKSVEE